MGAFHFLSDDKFNFVTKIEEARQRSRVTERSRYVKIDFFSCCLLLMLSVVDVDVVKLFARIKVIEETQYTLLKKQHAVSIYSKSSRAEPKSVLRYH